MKRFLIATVVTLALVGGGAYFYFRTMSPQQKADLQNWIGQQFVGVINSYIQPKVSFASLTYSPPYAVTIDGLTLTDQNEQIFSIDRLQLELAEVPRYGKPIQIARVALDAPQIAVLADGNGGFVGWSSFVKEDVAQDPSSVPEGKRLSDVFQLRHLEIRDGQIIYADDDARNGDESGEMRLDGIELTMDTPPLEDEPGWYELLGEFGRAPLLQISFDGRINLDDALLDFQELTLETGLDEERLAALPPPIQRLLRQYGARGNLSLSFLGRVPLKSPQETAGRLTADLSDAGLTIGDLSAHVDRITTQVLMPDAEVSVRVKNVSVTGEEQEILHLGGLQVDARGLPGLTGDVLQLDRVVVQQPTIRLVRANDDGGRFLGWRKALELAQSADKSATQPADGGTQSNAANVTDTAAAPPPIDLDTASVEDGAVVLDLADGSEPMELTDIDVTVEMPEDQSGRQQFAITVKRDPLLNINAEGQFDQTAGVVDIRGVEISAALGEAQYSTLPPRMQKLAREHGVQGQLRAHVEGQVRLREPRDSSGRAHVELHDARITAAGGTWPVSELTLDASVQDHAGTAKLAAHMLQGTLSANADVQVADTLPFTLAWHVQDMRIEDALRAMENEQKFAGRVTSNGKVAGNLAELPASLSGNGDVTIVEGRLLALPVLKDIALRVKSKLGFGDKPQDEGQAKFTIFGDHIEITESEIAAALLAARGKGTIGYDGQLDLAINAGALEKLQSKLGKIGELLSKISDKVVTYRVRGTFAEPKISVDPLGMGN